MMTRYVPKRCHCLPLLTLQDCAIPVAQHYVELQKELGDTLQESLKQFEHAQICSHAKQFVVHVSPLIHCIGMCRFPNHFEALSQKVIIPRNRGSNATASQTPYCQHAFASIFLFCCCADDNSHSTMHCCS